MIEIRAFAIKTKRGAAEPYVYCREIGRQDALVRITHRSITRGDIQFIENDWGDTRFPLVPAHEIVGVVEEIGPDVTELRRGDRVGIGFQLGACFECDYCRHGTEQFCPNQTVVGVNAYGGLAEQIIVDARFAFPLPGELESALATPLMSSGLTVYAAISFCRLPARARVARGPRSFGAPVSSCDGTQRIGALAFATEARDDRAARRAVHRQLECSLSGHIPQ